jgi:large subunit ribosomal protein L10
MNTQQKQDAVEELTAKIRDAQSMIVTDYRGLSVGQLADVRNQLRESGASLTVAKNTLARIAANQAEKPDLVSLLQGPTAIAFISDDPAAAAKKLSDIARTTRILQVRGAIVEGETLTADQVKELGDLPSRDVLQGQVVGTIAGPLQGAYATIAAPAREFLVVLDQYIEKRQAAEAA